MRQSGRVRVGRWAGHEDAAGQGCSICARARLHVAARGTMSHPALCLWAVAGPAAPSTPRGPSGPRAPGWASCSQWAESGRPAWHSTLEFELRRRERFATQAVARARVAACDQVQGSCHGRPAHGRGRPACGRILTQARSSPRLPGLPRLPAGPRRAGPRPGCLCPTGTLFKGAATPPLSPRAGRSARRRRARVALPAR